MNNIKQTRECKFSESGLGEEEKREENQRYTNIFIHYTEIKNPKMVISKIGKRKRKDALPPAKGIPPVQELPKRLIKKLLFSIVSMCTTYLKLSRNLSFNSVSWC